MMSRKSRGYLLTIIGVVSAFGVGVLGQGRRDPTAVTVVPHVISGANVGIRVVGPPDKDGKLRGLLVVKVDGKWVEVVAPMQVIGVGK